MSVAKTIEISADSAESFEDAVRQGIAKASQTVHGMSGAFVKEQLVTIANDQVENYRVHLKITFALD